MNARPLRLVTIAASAAGVAALPKVLDARKIRYLRSSANPLFESAAKVRSPGLIGVGAAGGAV